jgi:hypothetical protein
MVDQDTREPAPDEQQAGGSDTKLSAFDRYLLPCLKESTLWPVVIVLIAHAAAFLLPAILFSFRDRSPPAMLAIAVLFGLSLRACGSDWRRRKFGPLSGLLLAIWLLAAAAAYFANKWQLL